MATQRIVATGGTGKAGPWIPMAASPRPHMHPNSEVWRVNTLSTYNVLEACGLLGIHKVVAALVSNRRAKQVLGWKQEFFLR